MNVLTQVLRWFRIAAMACLVLMMLVTILDVTMRTLLNELLLGSVELVQFTLVAVVFLAFPETFLRDQHITVDVLDQTVSPSLLKRLRMLAAIATLILIAVMAWRTISPALDTIAIGDLTSDLQMSLFWYWLPVVIGSIAAAVTVLVVLLRDFVLTQSTED